MLRSTSAVRFGRIFELLLPERKRIASLREHNHNFYEKGPEGSRVPWGSRRPKKGPRDPKGSQVATLFTTKPFNVHGFFGHHCLALAPTADRPLGGLSILAGLRMRGVRVVLAEDNSLVLCSPFLALIEAYSSA